MSPTTDTFKQVNIDSALELVADGFQLDVIGSDLFRNALPTDRISLNPGLHDAGIDKTIAQITNGVIDEYQIQITPTSITGTIRGRDPGAFLLDTYYKKRYIREPATPVASSITPPLGAVPEVIGRFTAAGIAADAVASVGLTLSWETDNYELQDTFEAVGRVVDILKNLIRPWTFVEPFRTDIFLTGGVVIIRKRQFPIAAPDYTMTLADVRRNTLTLRLRKTKKVGILTVRGARVAAALSTNPENALTGGFLNLFITDEQTEEDTKETFSPAGVLQSIVHTIAVYSMPAHILLNQIKEEFTIAGGPPILNTRETIVNDWTQVAYDSSGQKGRPRQDASHVQRSRIDPSDPDKLFRLWDVDEIGYHYNDQGFQDEESKVTTTLDLGLAKFINNKMTTKSLRIKDTLMVEQITSNYTWDDDQKKWLFLDRDTQTSGGHPPGGPGRAAPLTRSSNAAQPRIGGSRQLEIQVQLSTDPDAQDIEISDTNLDLTAMQIVVDQFTAVQGLVEVESLFDGVAMPFLSRGKTIQFVGITDENGNPLSIPAQIMTSIKHKYGEQGGGSSMYTIQANAFGWR